jgi:lipopolysaccharide export system protein LptA
VYRSNLVAILLAVVTVGPPSVVMALPATNALQETVITSHTMMFDYGRSTCVFKGDVVVSEPRVKLECDQLYVFFDATNRVDSVVATDGVKVTQGDKRGTCDKAVYTAKTGAIVMTGNAKLHRGTDSMRGDKIEMFVNSERVTCSPARLVIFPSSIEKSRSKSDR